MALDGSINNLDKLESNGITAYIDPNLNAYMKQIGGINIDYVSSGPQGGGYTIRSGKQAEGSGCDGCTSC